MNARQPIERTLRQLIAQHIQDRPGATNAEIAKAIGMNDAAPTRVVLELNAMRTDGLLESEMEKGVLHYTLAVSMDEIMTSVEQLVALDLPDAIRPGTRAAQMWAALACGKERTARELASTLKCAAGSLDPTISALYKSRTIDRTKGANGVYRYHRPRTAALSAGGGVRNNTGSCALAPTTEGAAVQEPAPEHAGPLPPAALDAADATQIPPADPKLLAAGNRLLSGRLDGVAHALRGCGLPALAGVTGEEDLQPHVAALAVAHQKALRQIEELEGAAATGRMHGYRLEAELRDVREALDVVFLAGETSDGSECSTLYVAMMVATELRNACALIAKLEALLQSARNEADHLRRHSPSTTEVDHPPHYTAGSIECIDAIESALGPEGFCAYCRGNAIKYAWRAGLKGNAATDLAKGAWYLARCAGHDREAQADA